MWLLVTIKMIIQHNLIVLVLIVFQKVKKFVGNKNIKVNIQYF